jgi:DNA-binding NtrC family response regulator
MTKETRNVLCWAATPAQEDSIRLLGQRHWNVVTAREPQAVLELLDNDNFRVALICLSHWDEAIHRQLEHVLARQCATEWIALLPAQCLHSEHICRFLPATLFDYHTLPVDPERLDATLGHAYGMAMLKEKCGPRGTVALACSREMIGTSPAMQRLDAQIRKVASVNAPVLIAGESGTGKELTALAVHRHSARADGPFVAVNCGALPSSLIQSELFGYEKGAFTGAHRRKLGRLEAAAGGTVFLDEIGDLPLEQQTNLLRFLQEEAVDRIGSTQPVPVDVRVVAATHRDLERAVKEGRFREDLYYRLNVLRLEVPPLRERGEDIELLARFLFRKYSAEKSAHVKGFSQDALRCLTTHDWPGNVRELINRVRRAMVMAEAKLIRPSDLGLDRRNGARHMMTLEQARSVAEVQAIKVSLSLTQNNLTHAAQQLGVSRVTLYRLMDKYDINVSRNGGPSA